MCTVHACMYVCIILTGAFGKVYRGAYSNNGTTIDVAIKTLKGYTLNEVSMHVCIHFHTTCTDVTMVKAKEFIQECITAKQFSHPNVLGLIGVSVITEEAIPLMVLPYMHNGDVRSFVKSKRGDTIELTEFPEVHLTTMQIFDWLIYYIIKSHLNTVYV